MIKVSVIITAYNVEKYIRRCVDSALNQTLSEIEIIIVDDGSTDDTLTLLFSEYGQCENLKILTQNNSGVSSARNYGISSSQGEYIQHLDGDDWLEPDACKILYEEAMTYDLDMVISDFYIDDDEGNLLIWKDIEKGYYEPACVIKNVLYEKSASACWNKLIRSKLYMNVKYPVSLCYGEDLLVILMLLTRSKKISKVDCATVHYIQNPNSITNSKSRRYKYQNIIALHKFRKVMNKCNTFIEKDMGEAFKFSFYRKLEAFVESDIQLSYSYKKSFIIVCQFIKDDCYMFLKNGNVLAKVFFYLTKVSSSRKIIFFWLVTEKIFRMLKCYTKRYLHILFVKS